MKSNSKEPKYIHQDLVMAILLLVLGLFFFIGSFALPRSDNPINNVHTFPMIASGALVVLSFFNISAGIKKSKQLNRDLAEGKNTVPEMSWRKLRHPLTGMGMIVLYAIAVSVIGFFVSTAVFMVCSMLYLGYKRIGVIVLVTLGLELFIYVLFVQVLYTRMPAGLLF